MALLLLLIIYISFISLGLPDTILGVAWPLMQSDLNAPLEAAGFIYAATSIGTIISSLVSGKVLERFGTGKVTAISVLLTATGLLGYAWSPSIIWLLLFAIPLGMGAGAIDTGLNDYVAVNFQAKHMNWLHASWGIGAVAGPFILSQSIANGGGWRDSYSLIAIFQLILAFIIFISLPIWRKVDKRDDDFKEAIKHVQIEAVKTKPLQIPGVKLALLSFFVYSGVEQTMGLWASTYLIGSKGLDAKSAAEWVSMFFLTVTLGRLFSGFITFKVSNKQILRFSPVFILLGAVLLLLPLPNYMTLFSFLLIGWGSAPIFPGMLHETPERFGNQASRSVMGLQIAANYIGSLLLPPLFGLIAANFSVNLLPIFIIVYVLILIGSTEGISNLTKHNDTV